MRKDKPPTQRELTIVKIKRLVSCKGGDYEKSKDASSSGGSSSAA